MNPHVMLHIIFTVKNRLVQNHNIRSMFVVLEKIRGRNSIRALIREEIDDPLGRGFIHNTVKPEFVNTEAKNTRVDE